MTFCASAGISRRGIGHVGTLRNMLPTCPPTTDDIMSSPAAPRIAAMSGTGDDGKPYGLRYPWIHTDGGRSGSRRPRQKQDCTVRAIAIALVVPYDVAYDMIKDAGRKASRRFRLSDWLDTREWAARIPFPAIKGERRMNPAVFVERFPTGTFICKVARHVFAVIDGVVFDEFENRPDRCIYTAWRISRITTAAAET